jgi:hypothetical protein
MMLLTFETIAEKLPGGLGVRAIREWANAGLLLKDGRRVKLRTIAIGKQRLTTVTLLKEFLRQQQEGDEAVLQELDLEGLFRAAQTNRHGGVMIPTPYC